MRLAIIAASSYRTNGKLRELLHVEAQAGLFSQRLAEADAGFSVHAIRAERGLVDGVEAVIERSSEPLEALLFFFSGYAAVSEEGFPGLVLDGERLSTVSLQRLRRILARSAPSAMVVLDTVSAFNGQNGAHQMVDLYNQVLSGHDSGIHLFAAHAAASDVEDGLFPFTNLLASTLDWHASDRGLSPDDLYAAMRSEEGLFSRIPSVGFFPAKVPFQILMPGARAFGAPSAAPPAPLDRQALATAALARGDVEGALAEYAAALEELGQIPTPTHPPLYAKIGDALRVAGRKDDALAYYEGALGLDPKLVAALEGASELALELGKPTRAVELLQRWIALEPRAVDAADRASRVLAEKKNWEELAGLYEAVLDHTTDPAVAVELAFQVDSVCRDFLRRPERAIGSLERAVRLAPNDGRVRLRLAQLLEGPKGSPKTVAVALEHVVAALRADPSSAEGFRRALHLFQRAGRADAAWNAACALEVLGEADVNDSLLADAHRPDGLLAARASLTEEHWKKKMLCPERDPFLDDLFAALGPALVDVGLEAARRKKRLVAVDPSTEQDPNTSTVTLVKTLVWCARLLGVEVPKVHVIVEQRPPFVVPPVPAPTVFVARSLASGLEMRELAFLWSRQLPFVRPEHRAYALFPNVPELAALVLAALALGGAPGASFKELEGDTKLFARSLKRALTPDGIKDLENAASAFPVREAGARVLSWSKAVEFAAGRAGLLACGDAELAAKMVRRFPLSGLADAETQVKDLLGYSIGNEYALLRERLGVLVRA